MEDIGQSAWDYSIDLKETTVITQQNVSQNRSESNRVTVLSGREHRSSGFMGAYAR